VGSSATRQPGVSSARAWTLPLLFALGLVISLVLVFRVGTGPDAVCLLGRGWLLADKGVWAHLGAAASGGGNVPGGLTALLVGLPLMVWEDHRAAVLLVLLCHVAAYLLLDRLLGRALDHRARLIFAVVYWLNPWRLHQSVWLDNSNYVFLAGAVHLWACYRQRDRGRFVESLILTATVGLTMQLHLDALILVFSAGLLWLRGMWKPHWGGVALGAVVTLAALVPWAAEAAAHPEIVPTGGGLPSILYIWPPLKGLAYWLRYPSLWVSWRSMLNLDFTTGALAALDGGLRGFYDILGRYLMPLTVLVPLAANIRLARRRLRRGRRPAPRTARAWLAGYAGWSLAACFAANCLSPVPTMWWHNLVVFHAAALPVVLWAGALMRTRWAGLVRRAAAAWVVVAVILLAGIAVGGEQFRPPDPEAVRTASPPGHELLRDLRLDRFGWTNVPRQEAYFYRKYMSRYELPGAGDGDPAADGPASR